jgi:hypothetical protein
LPEEVAVEAPHSLAGVHGCLNPLCPRANWSEARLPRWWLRLDDGQLCEFAACDDACAHLAVRFVYARLGRAAEAAPLLHAPASAVAQ